MKRKISSLATLIVVLLLLIVPMFAFTASAAETEATLSFADKAQRTSFSTTKQVWEQNGIIFTNNKASSTTAVADYSKPARLYAGSSVTIEAPGNITKIVFDCNSSGYATAMKNSIGSAATASSDKVTVTLDGSSSSFAVAKLTAQVRLDSLTVTYTTGTTEPEPEPSCAHQNKTINDTATCTTAGTKTTTCTDCGEVLSTEDSPKKDHTYSDGVCSVCGTEAPTYTCTFVTPKGSTPRTTNTGSIIMPEEAEVTGDKYTFVGWATDTVISSTASPTLHKVGNEVAVTGNITFYAVYSYVEESGESGWIKKDISAISNTDVVVITMTKDNTTYGMTNDNGTTSAPTATKLTLSSSKDSITGDVADNLKWNIVVSGNVMTIYPNGVTKTWLYCTNTNNGVRVGTNDNKTFTLDTSGYLKHSGTSRYVGVYNGQDWRCYTTNTGNSNIANQTLAFYVFSEGATTYYTTSPEAAECSHENVTETVTKDATCTEKGLISVVCDDCGSQLPEKEIPISHNLVDGVCIKCNYTDTPVDPVGGIWELVTDVSTLKPGDKIVIVSKESNAALSTNQKENNRGQASVSKDGNYVTFYPDTQILILQAGNTEGSFAFYTGDGYLYAASSKSNHLKTETTLSDNGSWIITIEADGTATIKANGTNERNLLRYNSSSTGQLFSCYESGQSDVVIYKLEQEGVDPAKLYAASMTVGSNLAMNFYVSGTIGSDYRMTFNINGAVYEVTSSKQSNGYLVFTFDNIPPQMMGDTITAKLYKNGSDTVLDEVETSVKEYAKKVIEAYSDNEKLMNLIADMLKYGAAAQKYVEYKEDELVTDGIDLTGKGSTADPTTDDNHRSMITAESSEIDKSVYSFTAAGVRFDFDNKIYVKFKATGDATISLKCNGTYAGKNDLGDGTYIYYTDGIEAYSFDKVYTFELYVGGELHQTLTYSVNSYAYAKFTDEQTTAVDELALALYRYGLSAKAYTGK